MPSFENISKRIRVLIRCLFINKPKKRFIIKCKVSNYKEVKSRIKSKSGVYIFYEDEEKPVYIGVGGTTSGKSLVSRITQELKRYGKAGVGYDTGATLSKNIQRIEGVDVEVANDIISKFKLTVLIVGTNNKNRNRSLSQTLERLLITVYDPKYNLDK